MSSVKITHHFKDAALAESFQNGWVKGVYSWEDKSQPDPADTIEAVNSAICDSHTAFVLGFMSGRAARRFDG